MNKPLAILGLFCAALFANGVQAAIEVEDLDVDNSDIGSAQPIGPFVDNRITLDGFRGTVGSILDDDLADFYSFAALEGQTLTITVVAPQGAIELDDPIVGLFDPSGFFLDDDDDNDDGDPPGPGFNARLIFDITLTGTYFVAVSGYDDFGFTGEASNDLTAAEIAAFSDFSYQLGIETAPTVIPVPGALVLLGSALTTGLVGFRRRR